jgi:glycerophosphoryl diester phosphodiesterase
MAHRGWRGRYPENTLLAFTKAVELGADVLELDVHATRDGVLVVSHDDTVDRTTDGSGLLRNMTWAEVSRLDAGSSWTTDGESFPFRGRGLGLPALDEVLAAFPQHWLNIDIKQHAPPIAEQLADLIREYRAEARVCVGSFSDDTIAAFRRSCPEAATAASPGEVRRLFLLSRLGLAGLYRRRTEVAVQIPRRQGRFTLITPGFVRAAHANRLAVHVWTVNEPAEMRELLEAGADGLITDHPDRLIDILTGLDTA